MLFVDRQGRRLEVIQLDRGEGPINCVRVTCGGYLLGPGCSLLGRGYYLTAREALAWVEEESLVELIELRP